MKRVLTIVLFPTLLTGCDNAVQNMFDLVSGNRTEVTILSKSPVELTSKVIEYQLPTPAKVVGQMTSVCLSLQGGVSSGAPPNSNSPINSIIGGRNVSISAFSTSGETLKLVKPSQSWSMSGKIEKSGELSFCLRAKEGENIPNGSEFDRFEISSSSPMTVRGIYWESTNRWDSVN